MTAWGRERRHDFDAPRGAEAPRAVVLAFWSVAFVLGLVWAGIAGVQ